MYKIIADSCCDLPQELKDQVSVTLIPLHITVNGQSYVDDGSIDRLRLIEEMRLSPQAPTTACPSPGDFATAMSGDQDVFAVTMSNQVSGTYQSALTGSKIKAGSGRAHVFDSLSASVGQSLIISKLVDFIGEGLPYEEIVAKTEAFIADMCTFFVLDSLDNLIKNGRMSRLVGQVASMLHMRPIMGTDRGKIVLVEKARGAKNAMLKVTDNILRCTENLRGSGRAVRDTLFIAHCNCLDRAVALKEDILARSQDIKRICIVGTGGLSTTYANSGGIIVAY